MSLEQDIALLPQWVQIWINIIVLVPAISVVVLLFDRNTRKAAIVIFLLVGAGMLSVVALHAQLGMVRLLGLGHVIFWTPAAIYVWRKLASGSLRQPFRVVLWVLFLTLCAALVFDYLDVIRWILGERAPIV